MATAKELLEKAIDAGAWVPDSVISDYEAPALTDELAAKAFGDKYAGMSWAEGADRIEEPTIPSMANVIGILGLDSLGNTVGKDARTKEQKFIEEFPKKSARWKKKITNNNVYGERGWETVKEIWKQALLDRMQADIAKARKEATDDGLYAKYASIMFPRAVEHIANTGDFSAKDILADLGENMAMTVPGSVFTGIAGKGIAKVAPKAVKYFSVPGSNIVDGAVKGAGRVAGNLFGNAAVPVGAEAMDAAIYDDDDEGMEQRADFSAGDAAIGTAINQGVNRGLMRMAGPIIDRLSSGGMARGGMLKARQFIENLGQSFSKKGDDYAADVARRVGTPVIAEAGEITPQGLRSVVHGGSDIMSEGQSRQALEQALGEQAVLKAIDRGELTFQPKIAQHSSNGIKGQGTSAELKKATTELDDAIKNGANQELITKEAMNTAIADAVSDKGTATPIRFLFSYPPYGIRGGDVPLTADVLNKVIEKNPAEIINYAAWHGNGGAGKSDRILNTLNQAIPAWAVNKYGSEGDADMLLSPAPSLKDALKESRQEVQDAPKKRKATADVLRIVSEGDSLTADDRKYLDAIAKNPDIMKIGYKDDPGGFRLWLLERGNRLLQGTSVYRPTFPVK